jgi:hypothetical protein
LIVSSFALVGASFPLGYQNFRSEARQRTSQWSTISSRPFSWRLAVWNFDGRFTHKVYRPAADGSPATFDKLPLTSSIVSGGSIQKP